MQKDLTEEEKRGNVDKLKNNGNPTPALVVKLILVLVFLLTAAFVSGVVIGKNGRRNIDRTSSDEEGINEKLSNCIFNSDELREKYLKLRDAAREKGLVDENDVVNAKVICKSAETFQETSLQEKTDPVEQPESVESKPEKPESVVQTLPEKSLQEKTRPEEKNVEKLPETSTKEPLKPEKAEKHDTNKTIDEILTEKKAEQKPVKKDEGKKCLFSIQIAFLDSIEQVNASKKEFKFLKLRVIDGDNNGKKWYKIRTGCFDSREAAEAELTKVKSVKKDAFIVSE